MLYSHISAAWSYEREVVKHNREHGKDNVEKIH